MVGLFVCLLFHSPEESNCYVREHLSRARSHTSVLALTNNTSGKSKTVLLLQEKEDTQGTLRALYSVPVQDKMVSFLVDFLTSATVCCLFCMAKTVELSSCSSRLLCFKTVTVQGLFSGTLNNLLVRCAMSR